MKGTLMILAMGIILTVQIMSHEVAGLKYITGGGVRGEGEERGVWERKRNGERRSKRLWDSDRQSQNLGIATFPS